MKRGREFNVPSWYVTPASGGSSGLADGDYGDITVSGGGTAMNIDAGVVGTPELGGDVTAAGKALLDDANAAAQRTTLGLGTAATSATTDFEATGAVATHAALTTTHGISAFGATLVDDANATAARSTLGLGTAATSAATAFEASGAVGTHAAVTSSVHGISAFGAALVDDADATAARTTLGLGTAATSAATAFAAAATTISTTAPLAGGGDLSANRTLTVATFGAAASGVVPSSGGGTTNFLRADGTWAAPPSGSGGVSDGDKGDITVTGSGATWTIDPAAVTYAKIQNVSATDKLLGRSTAAAGPVEEIACTAAGRALIDDADAAAQRTTLGLATVASSASATDLTAGTLPAARMPAHTGDVTSVAGAVALTIATNIVSNAKLAQVATATFRGRATAGTGNVEDMTATQATALLDTVTETAKGLMPANMGRKASLATNKSIANTLTQVVGYTAAANTLKAGTVIRFQAIGLQTNTTTASTSVHTLRINAASLGAVIEASWSCVMGTVARTNVPFYIDGEIVVLSAGVGGAGAGQAFGCIMVSNNGLAYAAPTTVVTAAVNVNTTISNVVESACISGAATTTWNFISATIEIVQP